MRLTSGRCRTRSKRARMRSSGARARPERKLPVEQRVAVLGAEERDRFDVAALLVARDVAQEPLAARAVAERAGREPRERPLAGHRQRVESRDLRVRARSGRTRRTARRRRRLTARPSRAGARAPTTYHVGMADGSANGSSKCATIRSTNRERVGPHHELVVIGPDVLRHRGARRRARRMPARRSRWRRSSPAATRPRPSAPRPGSSRRRPTGTRRAGRR